MMITIAKYNENKLNVRQQLKKINRNQGIPSNVKSISWHLNRPVCLKNMFD